MSGPLGSDLVGVNSAGDFQSAGEEATWKEHIGWSPMACMERSLVEAVLLARVPTVLAPVGNCK